MAISLEEAANSIGRLVVYSNGYDPPEEGVITSVNDHYVFVRYKIAALYGTATDPNDLEWSDRSIKS